MPSRLRERLPWGTLRARLAVWNTAIVLVMTVAAILAARLAVRSTLNASVDDELRGGAREVALAVEELYPDVDAIVAEVRRKAAGQEQRGWFVHLITENGVTLWQSDICPAEVASFRPFNLDRVENVVQIGPYRYVRVRVAREGAPLIHVRVGTYATGMDAALAGLTRVLIGVGALVGLLAPAAGWWLAVRATRPVADILDTADRLDPARLADRLPVRGVGDELDHLAATINRLLDDVAAHVDRQQRFVADAAHELRGPLAAVQSAIEVALSHGRSTAEYRESLELVLEEARYLSKLANSLLLLAESGDDAVPVATTPVDIAEIVRQAAAMFTGAAEDSGVELTTCCPADKVLVPGDPGQLRQVVGNLLDNAIRFTPCGGRVEVSVTRDGSPDVVLLTVTDSGHGIAAEHVPRLFDRFYKVDRSRSRDGGTRSGGLGLPICQAIVERHGGTIAVTSQPGRGTTVTIDLPQSPQSPPPAAAPARRTGGSRISTATAHS